MKLDTDDVFARRSRKINKLSLRIAALDTLLRYAELEDPMVSWAFGYVVGLRQQLEKKLKKMDDRRYDLPEDNDVSDDVNDDVMSGWGDDSCEDPECEECNPPSSLADIFAQALAARIAESKAIAEQEEQKAAGEGSKKSKGKKGGAK